MILFVAAVVATIGFFVVYLMMVRTAWGQRLDDTAVAGRVFGSERLRRGSGRLLGAISVGSLVLAALGLMTIALARRRWRLALGAGVMLVVSVVSAEVLKLRLLTRPALITEPAQWMHNTFPSGHTTVAVALGLALVLVTPQRRRTLAGAIGFLYASVIGSGVVAAGWHRPSDPIGAILMTFAIGCVVCAVMILWRGGVDLPDHPPPPANWVRIIVWTCVAAFPVAIAARTVLGHHPQLVWSTIGRHFVLASLGIDGLCLVAFLSFVLLLRGVSLDPPARDQPLSELTTHMA